MRFVFTLSMLFGVVACSPASPKPGAVSEPAPVTGEPASPHSADHHTPEGQTPSERPAATAAPTSTPAAGGVAKEPNALLVELTIEGAKLSLSESDTNALQSEFAKLASGSSRVAVHPAPSLTGGRHVLARLVVFAPTDAKDTLTQKLQIVGVTANGRCPLFDLGGQASMGGGKKDNTDDLAAVRKAAVEQIFKKLDAEAPTFKPAQSCTPEKSPKQ